jgi:hypothetical protein
MLPPHLCQSIQGEWDLYVPAAAFASNNSYHTSTFNTPFFLNYGRHPRMPFAAEIDRTTQPHVPAASDFAADLPARDL